jgi:hypothetical protein
MGRRRSRKTAAQVLSLSDAEAQFERELEVFRTEVESAAQFFYAFLAVHAAAGARPKVLHLLRLAPLFWNTTLGGLQTASFVALGRVFDQDSTHNVDRLFRSAQDTPEMFTRAALAGRKQQAIGVAAAAAFARTAYEPVPSDFRRLRKNIKKHRGAYAERYAPLRNKLFAHKELSDGASISELFGRTNIREMQRMLTFLLSLYGALWQLFHNGQKPVLKPQRFFGCGYASASSERTAREFCA